MFNLDDMVAQSQSAVTNLTSVQDVLYNSSQQINSTLEKFNVTAGSSTAPTASAMQVRILSAELRYSITQFNNSIVIVKASVKSVEGMVTQLKANVTNTLNMASDMISNVRLKLLEAKCAPLGTNYELFSDYMCNRLPPVSMTLVVMSAIIALLMLAAFIVLIIASIKA